MLQLLNRCLHRVQYSTYTTTFIRGNKVNFVKLISRMSSTNIPVITDLTTKVKLNDGYLMPCYGLGVYMASSGVDKEAENATLFALQNGYRLIDTAQFYE